jgi:hypothetical protein
MVRDEAATASRSKKVRVMRGITVAVRFEHGGYCCNAPIAFDRAQAARHTFASRRASKTRRHRELK